MFFKNSKSKRSDLIYAAHNGDIERAKNLLENGVSVDAKCDWGSTKGNFPLYQAISALELHPKKEKLQKQIDMIEFLITSGANIDFKNKNGQTSLVIAIIKSFPEIVEILIKAGANVNIKDNLGWTPLMYAATKFGSGRNIPDNLKMIDLLLKNGAKIKEKSNKGETAFDIALKESRGPIIGKFKPSPILQKLDDADEIDWDNIKYSK